LIPVSEEVSVNMWTNNEKQSLPPTYGCQLILSDVSEETSKDPSLPNDAYNVYYYDYNGKMCLDVCRGKKVNIFDMYYDKFGPGKLFKIDFGYGRTNPKLWGYKPPETKKKR